MHGSRKKFGFSNFCLSIFMTMFCRCDHPNDVQKCRLRVIVGNAMKILAFISVLIHGSLAQTSAIAGLADALLSKDANLSLPDQHFNVTITRNSTKCLEKVYMFNLTNGFLHTPWIPRKSKSGNACAAASGTAIHVTCRVATAGWYATYDGVIYNGTQPPDEISTESFSVNVTMEEYKLPRNPADITVYISAPNPQSDDQGLE
ncbi:uncharacterized protein LOC142591171 isoform X2 [Dermacentor variabilis]|uniref:uncharacterized protein LOC142591171 isoform X2 n=1 Tax=Dermacentor variabilis TaxID=34621 RepID=UPI003F5B8ED7